MPLLSIIMPVYNGEKYISSCIDDIMIQSFDDFELIIVDDASTDSTPLLLTQFAARDERIRIITHTRNLHAGASRNDGMMLATGDYLLFLDADDRFEHDMLQCIIDEACINEADVVLFDADKLEDSTGKRVAGAFYLNVGLLPKKPFSGHDVQTKIFQICTPEPWIKLFKRSFILDNKLRYQDMQNANDLYFTISAIALAKRITYVQKILVHHRIGISNSVQACKTEEPLAFLIALKALQGSLKEWGLFDEYKMSFTNMVVFHCLYNEMAPVDWAAVLNDFGVSHLRRSDYYIESDFGRCVELVLKSDNIELLKREFGADFWFDAACWYMEQEHKKINELKRKDDELKKMMDSFSFKIGRGVTSLPRTIRDYIKKWK